jgi:hypothetical protein
MQSPAETPSPGDARKASASSQGWESDPAASGFAGLLATLTAPGQKSGSAWNDDDLADDVATLSYERALRTHARYKSSDPGGWPLTGAANPEPSLFHPADATPPAALDANTDADAEASPLSAEPDRKCASITIRLSKAECTQLRSRAAEAGLTLSAYLRSCTLEAEALRAEVKEALAQLRSGASAPRPAAPLRRSWFGWLLRLLPRWHPCQRVVHACSEARADAS